LVSTKLDTFCYPTVQLHRATCRRFDTIPACDRRTDGQTDRRIVVASTALAMRELRRALNTEGPVNWKTAIKVGNYQRRTKFAQNMQEIERNTTTTNTQGEEK